MMRETKYRGLSVKTKRWAYGYYCEIDGQHFILLQDAQYEWQEDAYRIVGMVEGIPETVGEYIGKHDYKRTEEYPEGQEIYGGDIVHFVDPKDLGRPKVHKSIVQWFQEGCCYEYAEIGGNKSWGLHKFSMNRIEVIGDIHTTPELMEPDPDNCLTQQIRKLEGIEQ